MEDSPALVDVFTPGRTPHVTYNPREGQDVEPTIKRYLANLGAALTVSGPTKSGKTVVVQRLLPEDEALWVAGGDLQSLDDLWIRVIDYLNLYDQVQVTTSTSDGLSPSIGATIGFPGLGSITASAGAKSETATAVTMSAKRPLAEVARQALSDVSVPLVIDDFHYVPDKLKKSLVRAIKGLVAAIPVVLIAVPQDAFRVVQEETDMVGRVWQLEIKPWAEDELKYIAQAGFAALNLEDPNDAIASEFARNSLGAPFLMQQLCLDYCIGVGVRDRVAGSAMAVLLPDNLQQFYGDVATRYVPGVFESLKMGPRTKGQQRLPRKLRDGRVTDIYGAVLFGLSKVGPLRQIPTQQLARTIGEYFEEQPPTQNVASALGHLKAIADQRRGTGDAVLDYRNDMLFVADPFLSFYLRCGDWELPSPPVGTI